MSSTWYIQSTKGRAGPLALEEVREQIFNGAVLPGDLAWCPGMPEWKKVSDLPAFYPPSPQDEVVKPASELFSADVVDAAEGVELETRSFLNVGKPARERAPSEQQVRVTPIGILPLARTGELDGSAKPRFSNTVWRSLLMALIVSALSYAAFSTLDSDVLIPKGFFARLFRGFVSFPKVTDISEQDNALLEAAAKSDLKNTGPTLEMATSSERPESNVIYVATNLPEGTAFDLYLRAIPEALVGESTEIPPLSLTVAKHLGKARTMRLVPGYYWSILIAAEQQPENSRAWIEKFPEAAHPETVVVPTGKKALLVRKVFLGGAPDLSYQTRLKDYGAVRHGMARAELERLRDAAAKMEGLLAVENQAAASLSELRIETAKAQAWELFHSTWTQAFTDIQSLLVKPARFSGKAQQLAVEAQETLRKLHEKHQGLVATHTPESAPQLSAGSVASARIFADAHAISSDLTSRLQALKLQIDAAEKRLENPLEILVEERFSR